MSRSHLLGLMAILVCAVAVRFLGLLTHPTIPDEAFTFFIAAHSLLGIITLLKTGDFHPPLVYLIGHALFAATSRAYLFRIVSASFGVAGVAATYFLARRMLAPNYALLAALLVAVCPPLVFYDGFFRMYALLWSLCVISWLCLVRGLEMPQRASRWFAYGVALCALLYTQYLAFFTVVAQAGYVLFVRPRTKGFWVALALACLAFAPWLPILIEQYPLGGTAYSALHGHLAQLWFLPSVLLIDGLPASLALNTFVIALLWLLIIAGAIIAVRERRWLASGLALPLVLQMIYSLVSGKLLFGQRYMLQVIPALAVLVCITISWLASSRFRVTSAALATGLSAMMLAGTLDKHFLSSYAPIDWTEYGRFLSSLVQPGDAVIFDGSMAYYPLVGTKATQDRQVFLVTNPQEASRYASQAARISRVWYVGYQTELPDPQRRVFSELARTHPQHRSWRSTSAAYGDVVLTTLFLGPGVNRGP